VIFAVTICLCDTPEIENRMKLRMRWVEVGSLPTRSSVAGVAGSPLEMLGSVVGEFELMIDA